MSAIFNLVGKLDVNKVLLNSSTKVSEQLSLLAFEIFGGIFTFFVWRFLNSFSISDKEASPKENDAGTFSFNENTLMVNWLNNSLFYSF